MITRILLICTLLIGKVSFAGPGSRFFKKPNIWLGISGLAAASYSKYHFTTNNNQKLITSAWNKDSLPNGIPEELDDIIDFMTNPEPYEKLQAKLPRGALLYGPPGTGKTTLAREIAKHAKRKFLYSSGSELTAHLHGLGADRVRELFSEAKKNDKSIIFIDEIELISGSRDNSSGNNLEQLSELLNQIDGFNKDNNIFVFGATNRPEDIDEALLRPGRLEKHIYIGLPDVEGRKKIIKHYLDKTKFSGNSESIINLLSQSTNLYSGAELEALVNNAIIIAARKRTSAITEQDLLQSLTNANKKKVTVYV